jgi:hypothetical protein
MEVTIKEALKELDLVLLDKGLKMVNPILDEDLGIVLYYAHLYKCKKQEKYKHETIKLFNLLINRFEDYNYYKSFLHGFEGVFYVVNYLKKVKIHDFHEIIESELLENLLISLNTSIENNQFMFWHGALGKSLFFLVSDNYSIDFKTELFGKIIDKLYHTRLYTNGLITWDDYWIRKEHDISFHMQILNFLFKLKQNSIKHEKLDFLIDELIKLPFDISNVTSTIVIENKLQEKNIPINNLVFTVYYLKAVNSLIVYDKFFNTTNKDLSKTIDDLIKKICSYSIQDSGIIHFEKYNFYDLSLNQGIGNMVLLLNNINQLIENSEIQQSLIYWKDLLIKNVKKVLDTQNNKVLLPEYVYQNETNDYQYDKYSLLDGLLGSSFILSGILYDEFEWQEIISI